MKERKSNSRLKEERSQLLKMNKIKYRKIIRGQIRLKKKRKKRKKKSHLSNLKRSANLTKTMNIFLNKFKRTQINLNSLILNNSLK